MRCRVNKIIKQYQYLAKSRQVRLVAPGKQVVLTAAVTRQNTKLVLGVWSELTSYTQTLLGDSQ